MLDRLTIRLPPLDEQKRIAAVLWAVTAKIELNRKMNRTLEEMAQAIFKSWFIDFDGVPESEMVDSELGPIPKGWELTTLGSETTKITKGTTPHRRAIEQAPDGASVRFLKVKDIGDDGYVEISGIERIPRSIHEGPLRRSILHRGDVLFTIAGTIGRVAVVSEQLHDANTNQAVALLRPGTSDDSVDSEFVRLLLRGGVAQRFAAARVVQGVQANVSLGVLSSLPFAKPPTARLREFRQANGPLARRHMLLDDESRTLAALRDTLLPKLISGELRVPEAEQLAELAL